MTLSRIWSLRGDYFIPLRIMLLARMIERETSRHLHGEANISAAEWRVLAFACTMKSISAAEICAAFEVDRAEVSRAVSRLLKAGLILREPDSRHSQKMTIRPTALGRDMFDRAQELRSAYFATIVESLTPEERQSFEHGLEQIALRVDEQRSTPPLREDELDGTEDPAGSTALSG